MTLVKKIVIRDVKRNDPISDLANVFMWLFERKQMIGIKTGAEILMRRKQFEHFLGIAPYARARKILYADNSIKTICILGKTGKGSLGALKMSSSLLVANGFAAGMHDKSLDAYRTALFDQPLKVLYRVITEIGV